MFQVPYDYDPGLHEIVDTPVARFFRRALKSPFLVTYRIRETGEWVLSLFYRRPMDGSTPSLVDVSPLGMSWDVPRWFAQSIIQRCMDLITKREAKKILQKKRREAFDQWNEDQQKDRKVMRAYYKRLQKRHGEVKAERFKRTYPGALTAITQPDELPKVF